MERRRSTLRHGLWLVLALALTGCGSIFCPGDVPMALVTTVDGGHATQAACEPLRAAATCAPLITGPDAACTTHCKSGTFPSFCVPSAKNPAFTVSQACYPVEGTPVTWAFSCVKSATCVCV